MTAEARPLLVTGVAGFVGHRVVEALLDRGETVVGVDSVNEYYDVRLKEARLATLVGRPGFAFHRLDLADRAPTEALFAEVRPRRVVHLAAQAGVRYSLSHPHEYVRSNVTAFLHVLEGCRHQGVGHLVYASSSSVYGANSTMPFSEHHPTDHPLSLYAATKKSNEQMAHTYAHLFGLPATGLRFFTVYGPWGRPDMALFLFADAILAGRPIPLFNHGDMRRDFTFVDDVAEAVARVVDLVPAADPGWSGAAPADPATSHAPHRLYNVGNESPVPLLDLVRALEDALGRRATLELLPMQPGDVRETCASTADLGAAIGWRPSTPLATGVARFVDWYRGWYRPGGGAG